MASHNLALQFAPDENANLLLVGCFRLCEYEWVASDTAKHSWERDWFCFSARNLTLRRQLQYQGGLRPLCPCFGLDLQVNRPVCAP